MTDKELIELAAKAIGAKDYTDKDWPGLCLSGEPDILPFYVNLRGGGAIEWNPLTDDGDALRLADHLDLIVDFSRFAAIQADRFYLGHRDFALGNNVNEAITRAAAQIGKEME